MNSEAQQLLWENIRKGERSALEQLYKLYYSDLFLYALRLMEDKALAEDAVQDTFIDLWNYRTQLGAVQKLKFYLIRSVRNQCIKLIKKEKQTEDLEEVHPFKVSIQPEELELNDPSDATKKRLEEAFKALSPRQREIIYLKYYNNLDYEEIATLLSINYQSVVNHIHKSILKLRKAAVLQHLKF